MIVLPTPAEAVCLLRGRGTFTLRDRQGRVKAKVPFKNAATTTGRNLMLNVMFRGTAALTSWYCGLIDTSTATLAAADTMSSHAGWTENTGYSNAARIQWSPGAAASSLLSAALATTFNFNATSTLYGIFIVSDSTKGGTAGTLWATGGFDAAQSVVDTDTGTITYECELQAVA